MTKSMIDFFYYGAVVAVGIIVALFVVAEIDERFHENKDISWLLCASIGVLIFLAFLHYYH